MRAVTGPDVIRLVRQIAPSAAIRKHGSYRPRRSGVSVSAGLAGPSKDTLRRTDRCVSTRRLRPGFRRDSECDVLMTSGRDWAAGLGGMTESTLG